jgi:hypothetical protein
VSWRSISGLERLGVDVGRDLAGAQAQHGGLRYPGHLHLGLVGPHQPQVGVEDRDRDRRLLDQAVGDGQVGLDAPYGGDVGAHTEGVDPPVGVVQPHVAEFHVLVGAVLVPHREDARPGRACLDLLEQLRDQGVVLRGDQPRAAVPEDLVRRVPEQLFGLGAPQGDASVVVQDERGDPQQVQQPARCGADAVCLADPGPEVVRTHTGPLSCRLPPKRCTGA